MGFSLADADIYRNQGSQYMMKIFWADTFGQFSFFFLSRKI